MQKWLFPFLLVFFPLKADKEVISNLFYLEEYGKAYSYAEKSTPLTPFLYKSLIISSALLGNYEKSVELFDGFTKYFPLEAQNAYFLETWAWAVLKRSIESSHLLERAYALLALTTLKDARAVSFLHKELLSLHPVQRKMAVEAASHFGDRLLIDTLIAIAKEDKDLSIRTTAIVNLGKLQQKELQPYFWELLNDKERKVREAAALALAYLIEEPDDRLFSHLSRSSTPEMRYLLLLLWKKFSLEVTHPLFLPLSQDRHPLIKREAWIYLLSHTKEKEEFIKYKETLSEEKDEKILLFAAWKEMGFGNPYPLYTFLDVEKRTTRLMAATLLGTHLQQKEKLHALFRESKDPYIKLSTAQSLLAWREINEEEIHFLKNFLKENNDLLTHEKLGPFTIIKPLRGISPEPQQLLESLSLRLNIWKNLIYIDKAPPLEEFFTYFPRSLLNQSLLIQFLLSYEQEAGESFLRAHYTEKTQDFFFELLCILWKHDTKAAEARMKNFSTLERPQQELLLEVLASLHIKPLIPYFCNGLKSPYGALRILHAFALIHTLND